MKEQALWLYQRLTKKSRQNLLRTLQETNRVPVAVLFYHRVADSSPNAWTLSCKDFSRHLDWLHDNYDIVSLEEAQTRIRSMGCVRPTVSITFDDGYAENADFAIPELVRRSLPATYFVSTDFVRTGVSFPHDVAAGNPLPPNTVEHLKEFSSQGIEIGAHTRSHADLGRLENEEAIRNEIVGSARDLEAWVGDSIRYFAFPYGLPKNTSQLAVDVIASAGFAGFCTAYGDWNWPNSTGFHLRRIHADQGLERLKNWLTYDARKFDQKFDVPFLEPHHAERMLAPDSIKVS